MNFRKNLYAISISAAMMAMSGCGITPQDEGLGASSAKPMSGVVVDGYLAGAIVYIDVNENNKLDAWEKRALTDTKGYFSFNPITGVNYCSDFAETDAKYIHCLKAPSGYDSVMVRMTGGYDLATVEPFTGTISMMVDVTTAVIDTPMVATPITGLMSEMSEDQKLQFMTDEGITDVAHKDFLNYSSPLVAGADAATDAVDRRKLLNIALKAHKIADVAANLLDSYYDQSQSVDVGFFGIDENIPTDGSLYVYRAMVSQISATNSLTSILSDATKLTAVINQAILNMNGVVEDYNDRLPHDLTTDELSNPADAFVTPATLDGAAVTAIVNKLLKISQTVETVFGTSVTLDGAALSDDVISRIRAIDAVVSLTRNGEAAGAVDNAVTLAGDSAYLTNLRFAGTDMVSLKKKFVATPGSVVAADADYSTRESFTSLIAGGGSPFTGTGGGTANDQGFAGNTLDLTKDSADPAAEAVTIDFLAVDSDGNPDLAADNGTMKISASSLGGDYATNDGSDLILDGTWEKIDDYTMLMNVEVTDGVFEPVIVKPNDDGTGYYFDLGGDQVVWE